jgi:hypothetical protein
MPLKQDYRHALEYLVAAGLVATAFVISPIGIKLITGRTDLTFRVDVVSIACDLFLIAVIAALVTYGWPRRICFHAVAWTFPFAALAAIEGISLSVRLADRIAPLEDTSILTHKGSWPAHLMSDTRSRQWIATLPALAR